MDERRAPGQVDQLDAVVVGSANIDLNLRLGRLPAPGETLLADIATKGPGGKGLNQAVALARLGRRTAFLGAIGDDVDGRLLRATLAREGVEDLTVLVDADTGIAVVMVDEAGESSIVVSPGANSELGLQQVREHQDKIASARLVLSQHEVSPGAVHAAAELASGLFVVNPAPARPVPAAVMSRVDVLVPNRTELATLNGVRLTGGEAPDDLAALARRLGCRNVVVTLGAGGALVVTPDGHHSLPARPVRVVDATAAGDTFCAALCDALLSGAGLVDAAAWACNAASVTVSRAGAAATVPTRAEVLALG